MSSPRSLTSNGFVKPNATILLAIWRICLAEWVLGLRELGLICLKDSACAATWLFFDSERGAQLAFGGALIEAPNSAASTRLRLCLFIVRSPVCRLSGGRQYCRDDRNVAHKKFSKLLLIK